VRIEDLLDARGVGPAPVPIARWFGAAGEDYMEKYGAGPELFAKVSVKSRNHAARNPYALLTAPITEEEVLTSPVIYGNYMTKFMACPPTCGAAAAVIVSEPFARHHGLENCVEITAQALTTDTPKSWDDPIMAIGSDNVRRAADQVYETAGIGPEDVDVVELHDCFTPNEVITYEGLRLCGEGEAERFVEAGDNTYGGQVVVNPSGGLMSKGHPIGATGLAQCCELTWQLRGTAGDRQVPDARVALQHNIGLVAAAAVTMYRPSAF
jgi:acetyl-CoA acetyltransferase